MNWTGLLRDWGVPITLSSDLETILVALLLVVGAAWTGWFTGRRSCRPIAHYISKLGDQPAWVDPPKLAAIIRYAVSAVILLVVSHAVHLGVLAEMAIAAAIGAFCGLCVFHLTALFGVGRIPATIGAAVVAIITTAGSLGGMAPLMSGLEDVGFSIGRRRFSLLLLVNAAVTIAILIVMARVAHRILHHAIGQTQALDPSQRVLVQKLGGIGVIVVAVLLGIDVLGIDLTALTVFSGALGLAVGFGLQKTFGNLIAGLILLMDRSIKPGDVIVVGDTFGAVNKIGVRAVSVVTRDGKEHLIPNEQLMTEPVENWSYSSRNVRVHVPVGISYASDLALAQRLMVEAAVAADRVLADPKPTVWLKGFGDNSVDHEILAWIADPELGVGNVQSDILNRLWRSFAEHGIEIPFPQRDIHIRTMPRDLARSGRSPLGAADTDRPPSE